LTLKYNDAFLHFVVIFTFLLQSYLDLGGSVKIAAGSGPEGGDVTVETGMRMAANAEGGRLIMTAADRFVVGQSERFFVTLTTHNNLLCSIQLATAKESISGLSSGPISLTTGTSLQASSGSILVSTGDSNLQGAAGDMTLRAGHGTGAFFKIITE